MEIKLKDDLTIGNDFVQDIFENFPNAVIEHIHPIGAFHLIISFEEWKKYPLINHKRYTNTFFNVFKISDLLLEQELILKLKYS